MPDFYRRQALLLDKVVRWARARRVYRVRGALALQTARELASLDLVFLEELPPEPESRIRYVSISPTQHGLAVWAEYARDPTHAFRHGGDRRSSSFRASARRAADEEGRLSRNGRSSGSSAVLATGSAKRVRHRHPGTRSAQSS